MLQAIGPDHPCQTSTPPIDSAGWCCFSKTTSDIGSDVAFLARHESPELAHSRLGESVLQDSVATATSLAHLGLSFPGALQLSSLHPARYQEICALIAAVRDHIGAQDFPETDAFLNRVYQRTKALGAS